MRVLVGGRRVSGSIGPIRIVVARHGDAPFAVAAEAFEEDTWLALSTETPVVRSPGHPVRVMTGVWESEPEKPGSVVVRSGVPLRLLAVVHDLDAEPTWKEEWVQSALAGVFLEVVERGLQAVKVPLLGTKHGQLPAPRFMALLRRILDDVLSTTPDGAPTLRRIWLARESESGESLLEALGATQRSSSPS